MLTLKTARERVREGMAWLDVQVPGGLDLIDVDELDAYSAAGLCPAGQAFGGISWFQVRELRPELRERARELGFLLRADQEDHHRGEQPERDAYAVLTAAWRIELRARERAQWVEKSATLDSWTSAQPDIRTQPEGS